MTVATPVLDAPPADRPDSLWPIDVLAKLEGEERVSALAGEVAVLAGTVDELIKIVHSQHTLIGFLMDEMGLSR